MKESLLKDYKTHCERERERERERESWNPRSSSGGGDATLLG